MNRELGIGNPAADPAIVIQTELLSITEVDPAGTQEFCDGIQVRDLSVLNPAKLYFPPISIPSAMARLPAGHESIPDQVG